MKQFFAERYCVKSLRADSELILNPDEDQSIEGARRAIDRANSDYQRNGYPARRFIICKTQFVKVRQDNGEFAMSTVVTVAVETYPN